MLNHIHVATVRILRLKNRFFVVVLVCLCRQATQQNPAELQYCDQLCEFSAWNKHAYCGERMLTDIPLQCNKAKTLDVRLNNIRSLRRDRLSRFQDLKYLYLVGNNISDVEEGAFEGCGGIELLSWGGNHFPRIERSKLVGLTNLKYMLLDGSNVEEIETDAFAETPILKTLDLSRNNFVQPPCDILNPETNILTDLYLSDNDISHLPGGCFSHFNHLERLKLSNNPIRVLKNESFKGLNSLKKLEMVNASLELLPVESFGHISATIELKLSKNLIQVLQERSFARLSALEVLRIDNNHIHTIHHLAFDGLDNLKRLVLSNNRISTIGQNAFLPAEPLLEELHLDGNQLKSIHNISASTILSLNKLSLARNPLECHCHLSTLLHLPLRISSEDQPDYMVTCRLPNGSNVSILETALCPEPTTLYTVNPGKGDTKQSMPIDSEKEENDKGGPMSYHQHLLVLFVVMTCFWIVSINLFIMRRICKKKCYTQEIEIYNKQGAI